jgi:hypothetical protein
MLMVPTMISAVVIILSSPHNLKGRYRCLGLIVSHSLSFQYTSGLKYMAVLECRKLEVRDKDEQEKSKLEC